MNGPTDEMRSLSTEPNRCGLNSSRRVCQRSAGVQICHRKARQGFVFVGDGPQFGRSYHIFQLGEAVKRPVAAVADHNEVRSVRSVKIGMDHSISMHMLFDPGHSLDERILGEAAHGPTDEGE